MEPGGAARGWISEEVLASGGLGRFTAPTRPLPSSEKRYPLNLSTALLGAASLLPLTITSCGTANRMGKDLSVTALSPAIALYGGATDGYAAAKAIGNGFGENAGVEVVALPFTFLWHTVKHVAYCGYHALDFVLFPAYGLAELNPNGPDVKPLDIYSGTIFDKKPGASTDAESGETIDR